MAETVKDDFIVLEDTIGTAEFHGVLLAEKTTEKAHLSRWTELELYRITQGDNAGQYMVQSVGCSMVYHRLDDGCDKGTEQRVSNLPEHASPCPICRPPQPTALGEDDTVLMEDTLFEVTHCRDVPALFVALRSKTDPKAVSGPGLGLLRIAAKTDSAIADAMNVVKRF